MLKSGECIVTAFAQPASGPGWSNRPVWIVIRRRDGTFRTESLQPNEQGEEIVTLYKVSAAANDAMTAAVRRQLERGQGS